MIYSRVHICPYSGLNLYLDKYHILWLEISATPDFKKCLDVLDKIIQTTCSKTLNDRAMTWFGHMGHKYFYVHAPVFLLETSLNWSCWSLTLSNLL